MKFFNKPSFVGIFLFVFSVTLVLMGSIQALFGTLRWYNTSEESHENLQSYPVYSAQEESKPKGAIRVFIAPRPTIPESNVYVFLQNTAPLREAALSTVTPEKAQNILQKIQDVEQEIIVPSPLPVQNFQSPVQLEIIPASASMPQGYPTTIGAVLAGQYFRDTLWQFPLKIDTNRVSPRGQMSNESVTLSGRIKTNSEMAKVLVHELGHMIDIYFLKQRGRTADPSKKFYAISWSEPTVIRAGTSAKSFVSGYAATNQYEDFAEAFTMYVFHNDAFAERAKNIPALQEKYDFFRNTVFGNHFFNTSYEQDVVPSSLWDVTKIVIKSDALRSIFVELSSVLKSLV